MKRTYLLPLLTALAILPAAGCQDIQSPLEPLPEPRRPVVREFNAQPRPVPAEIAGAAVEVTRGAPAESSLRRIHVGEALDIALRDNLDFALARAEQQVAQQRSRATDFSLYPSVQAATGVSRTDGQVQGSFGDLKKVEFDSFDSNLSLLYRLNIGAQVNEAIAAKREIDAAVLDTLSTKQRLLLRVTELYYDLVLTRVGVNVAEELLKSTGDLHSIADARSKSGVGSGSDVARSDARSADAQRQLVAAQTAWKQASIRLATALRLDAAVTLEPLESQLAPWQAPAGDDDPAKLAEERPDVQAAEQRIAAARQRADAAQWDLWGPEVVGRVEELFAGDNIDRIDDRQRYGIWVGWTLSLEKVARVDQRKAEELVTRLRALRVKDQALAEVQASLLDIRSAAQQIPLAQKEMEAAGTSLRLNTARFKSGTALAVEFIDSQDAVTRATLNLARAIGAYNVAQVRLLAASGVLDRQQLPGGPRE